jgi:hypothetical protein
MVAHILSGVLTMSKKLSRFVSTGGFLATGLFLSSAVPATTPHTQSEPAAVAQRVWGVLLTHCPTGDYFYAGSPSLDSGGMLSNVQVGKNPLLEFKGVTFHIVPMRVTDAEQANGIAYRGRITMIAHLYREESESWKDGPDLQRRNMSDIVGRVLADANGEFFGMGGGGSMAIQIVKFKGRWALARGSTDFSDSFGASGDFQFLDDFVKAPAPHYSCKDGKVIPVPGAEKSEPQKAADDESSDDTSDDK